jgi:hypothetical protein
MDAIKNQISDLQSPSTKKDHRTPESFPKAHARRSPVDSGFKPKASNSKKITPEPKRREPSPVIEIEDPLASRRQKREQEQKNFRDFLKAQQRHAKVSVHSDSLLPLSLFRSHKFLTLPPSPTILLQRSRYQHRHRKRALVPPLPTTRTSQLPR